jgi:Fuc2NAc and GlcNAc transferase
MSLAWVAAFGALLSLVLVGVVRRYALRRALLDVPSDRSSHTEPTPRGGGLGLIVACLLVVVVALRSGLRADWALSATLVAAAAVAVVGWLDDHGSLDVAPRLAVHLLAGLAVGWLARGVPGPLGLVGAAAAAWWVLWTVSSINVTNFLDGIDGMIGLQVLVFGLHIARLDAGHGSASILAAALVGSALGFLAWNWAPARVFMGDVGSAALGMLLVVTGVLAQRTGHWPVNLVFLPLFPIFLDAAVTLLRRWRRGASLTQAHRSHLYQRLANGGWGHARVSLVYGVAAATGLVVSAFAEGPRGPYVLACYFGTVALAGFLLDRFGMPFGRRGEDGTASP